MLVDSMLQLFGINLDAMYTFGDVLPVFFRILLGVMALRIVFDFFISIIPTSTKSVFRGL